MASGHSGITEVGLGKGASGGEDARVTQSDGTIQGAHLLTRATIDTLWVATNTRRPGWEDSPHPVDPFPFWTRGPTI